ncbi:hypothetical protein MSAN_00306000 [Mycena sanguinolenta]|uniref:Uncharacterized protein n=1 Tax=Mycena sanguinolenta TaxID=230812 RepID=A0A8H7DIA6_9AGAR|nr:hypothetical protein MSAN_00306000 [Mycena sanguinolenta]
MQQREDQREHFVFPSLPVLAVNSFIFSCTAFFTAAYICSFPRTSPAVASASPPFHALPASDGALRMMCSTVIRSSVLSASDTPPRVDRFASSPRVTRASRASAMPASRFTTCSPPSVQAHPSFCMRRVAACGSLVESRRTSRRAYEEGMRRTTVVVAEADLDAETSVKPSSLRHSCNAGHYAHLFMYAPSSSLPSPSQMRSIVARIYAPTPPSLPLRRRRRPVSGSAFSPARPLSLCLLLALPLALRLRSESILCFACGVSLRWESLAELCRAMAPRDSHGERIKIENGDREAFTAAWLAVRIPFRGSNSTVPLITALPRGSIPRIPPPSRIERIQLPYDFDCTLLIARIDSPISALCPQLLCTRALLRNPAVPASHCLHHVLESFGPGSLDAHPRKVGGGTAAFLQACEG